MRHNPRFQYGYDDPVQYEGRPHHVVAVSAEGGRPRYKLVPDDAPNADGKWADEDGMVLSSASGREMVAGRKGAPDGR